MSDKMIRNIIIGLLIAAGIVAGVVWANWWFSFHDVSFELSDEVVGITIREADPEYKLMGREVMRLTQNDTVRLQVGVYEIIPEGTRIDTSPIRFSVNDTTDIIKITPFFSESYLSELLDQERAAIHQALLDYSSLILHYDIYGESLYLYGEWYGALLRLPDSPGDQGADIHRVILHKNNGSWKVSAEPSIILSYSAHRDIPKTIINDLNRKVP